MGKIRPIDDSVSSKYLEDRGDYIHRGVDMIAKKNTPISSIDNGTVIWSNACKEHREYGYAVIIKHKDGTGSLYAHLDKPGMPAGTKVREGEIVGLSGNTGRSTGSHLHFESLGKEAVNAVEKYGRSGDLWEDKKAHTGVLGSFDRRNPEASIPDTTGEQLENDKEIQQQKEDRDLLRDEYIDFSNQLYESELLTYIRTGQEPSLEPKKEDEEELEEEATKSFPKLRRLEMIEKYKEQGKQNKLFKWIGSDNPNSCENCRESHGKIFNYTNPPSCGFPPIHPNCKCSIENATMDDLLDKFFDGSECRIQK